MQPSVTVPQMYSARYGLDKPGISGYTAPKIYQDPIKQIKARSLSNIRKGQKIDRSKIPPRPHYLNDLTKSASLIPAPGAYNIVDKSAWSRPQSSTQRRRKLTNRTTYLDDIVNTAIKEKPPAVGQYNLTKSLEQIQATNKRLSRKKRRTQTAAKSSFLDDAEFQAWITPGPGEYNPRPASGKFKRKAVPTPEQFKKAQLKLEEKKKKRPQTPDAGKYHPKHIDYQTFDDMGKQKSAVKSVWGNQARFITEASNTNNQGQNKSKAAKRYATPGPGQYQMIHAWRGKDARKRRQRDYLEATITQLSQSVYH